MAAVVDLTIDSASEHDDTTEQDMLLYTVEQDEVDIAGSPP